MPVLVGWWRCTSGSLNCVIYLEVTVDMALGLVGMITRAYYTAFPYPHLSEMKEVTFRHSGFGAFQATVSKTVNHSSTIENN
jgi:hypothetical protein